ncbi:hypothetical protein F4861DRAFT_535247 [Xylaria intraflava]|nr:hypothetical protein F4861DRAFT_535247 [Xylaria intraflava]
MQRNHSSWMKKQLGSQDDIRTLTIPRPSSTLIETLTLGNGIQQSTPGPVAAVSASDSSSPSSSHVGAILSGVAAAVVFLLIIWICCRGDSGRRRGSGRRSGSGGSPSESSSGSSGTFDGSSPNGGSTRSVVGVINDERGEQSAPPMPGMPPAVAEAWVGPLPGHTGPPPVVNMGPPPHGANMGPSPGAGMGPPPGASVVPTPGVGVTISVGRRGPPLMMGRNDGQPFRFHGGPPPPPSVS